MDKQTLLNQINQAIVVLLDSGASSYSIGQRSVTRLDLTALFAQRDKLMWEIARDANAGRALAKMGQVRP